MPSGQLCTIGDFPNVSRLFFYAVSRYGLFIEQIDRRHRERKHLVVLLDRHGTPVPIPEGSYFAHVASGEEMNLLENRLRDLSRTHDAQTAEATA